MWLCRRYERMGGRFGLCGVFLCGGVFYFFYFYFYFFLLFTFYFFPFTFCFLLFPFTFYFLLFRSSFSFSFSFSFSASLPSPPLFLFFGIFTTFGWGGKVSFRLATKSLGAAAASLLGFCDTHNPCVFTVLYFLLCWPWMISFLVFLSLSCTALGVSLFNHRRSIVRCQIGQRLLVTMEHYCVVRFSIWLDRRCIW